MEIVSLAFSTNDFFAANLKQVACCARARKVEDVIFPFFYLLLAQLSLFVLWLPFSPFFFFSLSSFLCVLDSGSSRKEKKKEMNLYFFPLSPADRMYSALRLSIPDTDRAAMKNGRETKLKTQNL